MNFKKLTALMLALVLVAALFVGCAGQEKPAESTVPQTTGAEKTEPAKTEAAKTEPAKTEAPATEPAKTEAPETEPAGTEAQLADFDEVFATINDVKVVLGAPYADVKEALGEETRPADVEGSCDPGSDWCRTYHHYEGIDVVEDQNGNVASIEMHEPADSVAFMGKIKLGAPLDTVYEVLGQHEPIFYTTDAVYIAIYPSEDESNTVSGIMAIAN